MEKTHPFKTQPFIDGNRSSFKSAPGPLEQKSAKLIDACRDGDRDTVHDLLLSGLLSPDIADSTGFTALQAATVIYLG